MNPACIPMRLKMYVYTFKTKKGMMEFKEFTSSKSEVMNWSFGYILML
jgi:hypothetical protein